MIVKLVLGMFAEAIVERQERRQLNKLAPIGQKIPEFASLY